MSMKIGWHHPVDESDQWDGFNDAGIETFAGSPIRHLAREVNQNSLDSGESDPIVVKMKLHQVDTNSLPDLEEFKNILLLCRDAAKNESPKAEVFFENALDLLGKKKINVLEISDYNTTGMEGPCENGKPFYAFVKAKGQSRKGSLAAAGSYGIGKFAPYSASNTRTIFVSTIYQDDSGEYRQLTQGKSILMSHDVGGKRKQGVGFWGNKEKCQPLEGVVPDLPVWLQRVKNEADLPKSKGSKLTVICFNAAKNWQEHLAVSVAENFFAAISDGKLRVEIDGKYTLEQSSIGDFLENKDIRKLIEKSKNEPEQFDNSKHYLKAFRDKTEVIVEQSEMRELGLCQLRILVGEGLPKKVCALRNGMFISDNLNRLKSFSEYKEFVAVFHCQSKKGNELLRLMEPPRHDDFEPERLPTKEEQRKGTIALRDLANWVREMLKRHAKDPVSEVTEIDELRDFFGDEGEKGAGGGAEEINPYGEILIRAKPIKMRVQNVVPAIEGDGDGGGVGEGPDGGGGGDGAGGGDGEGGVGIGTGGTGGGAQVSGVEIKNIRAVPIGLRMRKIGFTPQKTGKVCLRLFEAGADSDYEIPVAKTGVGAVEKGCVILDVMAGSRVSLEIELKQDFLGALKVVAHEV